MGANHTTTRASDKALHEYREACAHEVQPDGSVGAPCWLCGQPIDYAAAPTDWKNPDRFQRDHIKPVSTHKELADDPSNWAPSHAGCNLARSNKPPQPPLGQLSKSYT